ncbi:hypothetical protein J6K59_06600 [Leuconostoc mesenteroides]|uniref:hypothetical protein n=1 Tax=Leuconostoc mesenteroides TaxID=1245 RepID=UPI001CBAD955|nr:hypothetical protein [Leuconostoc mesenteroides]MBZ1506932.1 hypothetical protein [Leuconostoc mesenteroides]MBZ1525511.1 hypothetical protein [Leuconostoc mesenteroides]
MLNHRQTKIQFESLATLQAIQKKAYQMLIQSQVNQTDRRIVRLTLTTNGQETVQMSVRQVQANLKTFNHSHDLEKLTKQVGTLSQQLVKIN